MDRRDQKLSDKQLRAIQPLRHDGIIILALMAVFFVGIPIGDLLWSHKSKPAQIAADAPPSREADRGCVESAVLYQGHLIVTHSRRHGRTCSGHPD